MESVPARKHVRGLIFHPKNEWMERFSKLTGVNILAKYFDHELVHPNLIAIADSCVPTIDEVELGTDLVPDTLWRALSVENIVKCLPGIQPPIRINRIVVKVEDGAQVVSKDDVHIEAAGDTGMRQISILGPRVADSVSHASYRSSGLEQVIVSLQQRLLVARRIRTEPGRHTEASILVDGG